MTLIIKMHVFELRIDTNVYDPRSFERYLSSSARKTWKIQAFFATT